MKVDILTLFPQMFSGPFDESIVKRAQEKGLLEIKIHNLRSWAVDKRGTVDDRPFGGGVGMILKPEPIFAAVESVTALRASHSPSAKVVSGLVPANGEATTSHACRQAGVATTVLLTPQGKLFNQEKARELSKLENLILICGHYEGVDERVREHLVDEEISIGDYVLTGGELPAMVLTDAIARLIPGVLEKETVRADSFSFGVETGHAPSLQYPLYTRPENFRGFKVPEILLSGNHQEIEKWRKKQAEKRTREKRPDLIHQPPAGRTSTP